MAIQYSNPSPYFWGPEQHSISPHHQISLSSKPSADLDFSFCEEVNQTLIPYSYSIDETQKYVIIPYIAEFMNSISALAYGKHFQC